MTAATPEQTLAGEARELADEAVALGSSIARLLLGSARAAGLDPAMYAPLTGAALILGASQITVYTAEGRAHPDVSDAEDDARDLLTATRELARKTAAARDAALADLEDAQDDNAVARTAAAARLDLCQRTLAVLAELERRLRHAIGRLQAVPVVLGETYESVYSLIRSGGLMPTEGRWITGEDPAWPSARRPQHRPLSNPRDPAATPSHAAAARNRNPLEGTRTLHERQSEDPMRTCRDCRGTGRKQVRIFNTVTRKWTTLTETCLSCDGSGRAAKR